MVLTLGKVFQIDGHGACLLEKLHPSQIWGGVFSCGIYIDGYTVHLEACTTQSGSE